MRTRSTARPPRRCRPWPTGIMPSAPGSGVAARRCGSALRSWSTAAASSRCSPSRMLSPMAAAWFSATARPSRRRVSPKATRRAASRRVRCSVRAAGSIWRRKGADSGTSCPPTPRWRRRSCARSWSAAGPRERGRTDSPTSMSSRRSGPPRADCVTCSRRAGASGRTAFRTAPWTRGYVPASVRYTPSRARRRRRSSCCWAARPRARSSGRQARPMCLTWR